MSKSVNERGLIGIVFCVFLFVFGYFFVLNYISTMEDPPLGTTIYILIGTSLTILSVLGIVMILKHLYDYKKKKARKDRKRKSHKIFFLKDSKTKQP
jgi:cell division protein FtsW (lipid II flippase)